MVNKRLSPLMLRISALEAKGRGGHLLALLCTRRIEICALVRPVQRATGARANGGC